MEKRKMNTRYMATLAMFCGVLLVMGVTGIGFIPLPVIKATTMHIPVILGAVLLGPGAGAVLGGVFGLCSIWANTTSPGLLAFAFSPFMTTEGLPGKYVVGVSVGLPYVKAKPFPRLELVSIVKSINLPFSYHS